ncbi:MAG: iron ABC transporter permease [Bacteroidaceae bacterium]|nr:iron ABC transporter permease [Bacteroidaceae bacterium]
MTKPVSRSLTVCSALAVAILLLVAAGLCIGPVNIPFGKAAGVVFGHGSGSDAWDYIILESRFPSTVTALLAGAALSASGLMLQTAFRNPLAGPDILGINGGAGLGVAIVMMLFGGNLSMGSMSLGASVSVIVGAMAGAMAVTGLILALSARIKNPVVLLIAGVMVSYLASALISLLNFFSTAEGVHSYTMWGMGNFGGVSLSRLPLFACLALAGLLVALLLVKPLNAMLLGDMYARNLGVNVRRARLMLLLATSLLVAVTTAFCGPVSFIGLAVPHIARLMLGSSDHRRLMPVTVLSGAAVALVCNLASSLPGDRGLIPLNAITPAIGAPVILYVLLKQQRRD